MNPRHQNLLALVVVASAALLTFAPVLTNDFTWWDDHRTIHHNPLLNPPTWSGIAHYWRHPAMDLYVPVTYSVWGVTAMAATLSTPNEEGIWLNPALFHAVSLLVHMMAACLAFLVLRRLFDNSWAACGGALLFALHPVQTEPVAWASGLKDVLAGMFALAALHQYILFRLPRGAGLQPAFPPANNSLRPLHYIASATFLLLAMLSKPSAVMAPLLCVAYDLTIARLRWRAMLTSTLPLLMLALPVAYLTRRFQPALGVPFVPWHQRPLVALDALAFYLGKICWPIDLAFDYGHTPEVALSSHLIWISALVPVILAIAVLLTRRRVPPLAFAGCALLIPLAPVLGLVPFEFQGFSTVADHYLYLAMLGPACAFALALHRWPRAALPLAGIIILLLAVRSAMQTRYWANDLALYTRTIEVNPRSALSYSNRAVYLMSHGNKDQARRDVIKAREILSGRPSQADNILQKLDNPPSTEP